MAADAKQLKTFLNAQRPAAGGNLRLSVGLFFANGLAVIAQAFIVALIVNALAFEQASFGAIAPPLLALLPLFLLRAVLSYAGERYALRAATAVKRDLRVRVLDHLVALGPMALGDRPVGGLVTDLTDGLGAVELYYSRYLPAAILAGLVPFAMLCAVVPADWVSALVLVGTAPLIPVFMVLIGEGAERLNRRQWRKLTHMAGHFLDTVEGLTTLKILSASRREAINVERIADAYRHETMVVLRVAFLSAFALEFFATVSIAIVAVFIGFRLMWGEMTFLSGFFVLLLAPEFYLPLRTLGTAYHARMAAIGASERIVELLETPMPVATTGTKRVSGRDIAISFEDVHVIYADGRTGLNGMSFTVEPGERVALVGPSGAGKSTVFNLLLGFVAPSSGRILVNGVPLNELDMDLWRERFAYLPQRPHIFDATIAANIAMASPERIDPDRVREAAKRAGADGFIAALPEGYETPMRENGAGLSGGQVQRIALARAFHAEADLVLLDEASAHLDRQSEKAIAAALDRLKKDRTLFTIAHRLATVRRADRVLHLDNGRLVGDSPPDTILPGLGADLELDDEGRAP